MIDDVIGGGERLVIPERVIVAPATGQFRPCVDGARVELTMEQVIGFVDGNRHSTPVRSPFAGALMGFLAHAGERVREGQPVAWLRTA